MKSLFTILLVLFFYQSVFSQGEIDTEHKILFRNEKSYGININTNGFGFGYRYGKRINIHRKQLFEGNINIVKHEKERKIRNPYSENITRFVYGKTNSAFNLQIGYGMHHELYKKFDRNSVSIRWFYIAGITATFLKPIYYYVYNKDAENFEWQKFVKNTPYWYIYGKESYFYGISEMKIIPGIYAKTGFCFDFGNTDKKLNILELGFKFEAYPKRVKIMETEKNPQFLPILYLSYRFGKVESGYYLKEQDEGIPSSTDK